jgi:hypothetical protein
MDSLLSAMESRMEARFLSVFEKFEALNSKVDHLTEILENLQKTAGDPSPAIGSSKVTFKDDMLVSTSNRSNSSQNTVDETIRLARERQNLLAGQRELESGREEKKRQDELKKQNDERIVLTKRLEEERIKEEAKAEEARAEALRVQRQNRIAEEEARAKALQLEKERRIATEKAEQKAREDLKRAEMEKEKKMDQKLQALFDGPKKGKGSLFGDEPITSRKNIFDDEPNQPSSEKRAPSSEKKKPALFTADNEVDDFFSSLSSESSHVPREASDAAEHVSL